MFLVQLVRKVIKAMQVLKVHKELSVLKVHKA
jgi:hypothetical protein